MTDRKTAVNSEQASGTRPGAMLDDVAADPIRLLPGYTATELVYEGDRTAVYRAWRAADGAQVVLKTLRARYPTPMAVARLRREYEITAGLEIDGVVPALGLESFRNTLALVLQDTGAMSLRDVMHAPEATFAHDVKRFLRLSCQLAEVLGKLHQHRIVHKDIKPGNLLLNLESEKLWLIDFSICSLLPREDQVPVAATRLQGTLPYMSPEQTGRMNRSVDYRSDLYSMGVTLYELLAELLPFNVTDPTDWLHCHIAEAPCPLRELNPEVPPPLERIVMKLLAKDPEDRYQSAYGVLADLQACLDRLPTLSGWADFRPGQHDVSERFAVPQRLYGRTEAVNELRAACDRVSRGGRELVLVCGEPGVGKSAVIGELHKAVVGPKTFVVGGKFDQIKRDVPYSAIGEALRALVQLLLAGTDADLEYWKTTLLASLGPNGRLIADLVPELSQVIGPQPDPAQVPPQEARNRLRFVFQSFIRAFAQADHPLVLVVDDLQWADVASLDLLASLVTDPQTEHLLWVGSYRDGAVGDAHPLVRTVEQLKRLHTPVSEIRLEPLDIDAVAEMVADTLHCPPNEALAVAQTVVTKTRGNPFFVREFLEALHRQNAFVLDRASGRWIYETARLKQASITDNVAEHVANRVQALPPPTLGLLQLGACMGNTFGLLRLLALEQRTACDIAEALLPALEQGLILPTSDAYKYVADEMAHAVSAEGDAVGYAFAHDRILQAVAATLSEKRRAEIHLDIGRSQLETRPGSEPNVDVLEIVDHLNLGRALLATEPELVELAQLNLRAAKRAHASAAYNAALNYFRAGIELLPRDAWTAHYQLALDLHTGAAENAFLSGDFTTMATLADVAQEHARTLLDQTRIDEIRIDAAVSQGDHDAAITRGLAVLRRLGEPIPSRPHKGHIVTELVRTKLAFRGKDFAKLTSQPVLEDPLRKTMIRILPKLGAACYLSRQDLFPVVSLRTLRRAAIGHLEPPAATGLASYAIVLCGVLQQIEQGDRFGQIALQVLDHLGAEDQRAITLFLLNAFVTHWKHGLAQSIEPLRLAHRVGLETGDLNYSGYAASVAVGYQLLRGAELETVSREGWRCLATSDHPQQRTAEHLARVILQAAENLRDEAQKPATIDQLNGSACDESATRAFFAAEDNASGGLLVHFHKLWLCYLFERHEDAEVQALAAQSYAERAIGLAWHVDLFMLHSLNQLVLAHGLRGRKRRKLLRLVAARKKRLRHWSRHAPERLHKYLLVSAEDARVRGREATASRLYDQAIDEANRHGYLHDEALAHELAARHYLELNRERVAHFYLLNARYCYARWGAWAKVAQLDAAHPAARYALPGGELDGDTTKSVTGSSTTGSLVADIDTLTRATQAISAEVVLDRLLHTMMRIVLQSASAERGVLLLAAPDGLVVSVTGERESIDVPDDAPPLTTLQDRFCVGTIGYVWRTEETVVIDEACRSELFGQDPYVVAKKPRSILCVPVKHLGRSLGVLYLENNLTSHAFTRGRIDLLLILAAHVAVSIDNARIYANLEHKVRERTRELSEAMQQLEKLAVKDQLTGAFNRRKFDEILIDETYRATRYGTPLSLLLLDIDHFKRVNDTYGHQVGDDVLVELVRLLRLRLRITDTVTRWGGEEFAVLLPATDAPGAERTAEKMRRWVLEQRFPTVGQVTVSLGVAAYRAGETPAELVRRADRALYSAKEQGRNRVQTAEAPAGPFRVERHPKLDP